MVELYDDSPSEEAPPMTDCATTAIRFDTLTGLVLEASFDGGRLTSVADSRGWRLWINSWGYARR